MPTVRLGPGGSDFRAVVLKPHDVAHDAGHDGPTESLLLAALAHGRDEPETIGAAVEAMARPNDARANAYFNLLRDNLGDALDRALEALMTTGEHKCLSDFARKYFDDGVAKCAAPGQARFALLDARGLAPNAVQRGPHPGHAMSLSFASSFAPRAGQFLDNNEKLMARLATSPPVPLRDYSASSSSAFFARTSARASAFFLRAPPPSACGSPRSARSRHGRTSTATRSRTLARRWGSSAWTPCTAMIVDACSHGPSRAHWYRARIVESFLSR